MKKYPFQKLLIYLIVISCFDRRKFAKLLNKYLPSIVFRSEDPFDFINTLLQNSPIPKPILTGTYNSEAFNIFLKQQKLVNLHAIFDKSDFLDLIFDSDSVRKLQAMSLSDVFNILDIHNEFSGFNTLYLDTFLDCYASWGEIPNKHTFISTYIGDKQEQNLFLRILENTSRKYLKLILNIKISDASPLELMNNALNVVSMKMQDALISEDNAALERWLKLQCSISERLHKLGAGNKSDLDDLVEALRAVPTWEDPKIYSRQELEDKFIANQNP